MSYQTVEYEVSDHIATITLNRPERLNAVNYQLAGELIAALHEANDDSDVRAAILTGAGRAFSAGLDLSERTLGEEPEMTEGEAGTANHHDVHRVFEEIDVPLIAAVNGAAIGMASELALMCDFRVVAEGAFFEDKHVRLGIVPDIGSTWLLPRQIGWSRACEVLMLGQRVDAARADALGIATRVVSPEELLPAAREIGEQLAAGAPLAVRRTKRLMREGLTSEYHPSAMNALRAARELGETGDTQEAMVAFSERREPRFQGR